MIHSTHADSPVQFLVMYSLEDQSMFHRSRNSGRQLVGWNQLLCRSVLTPISCTKFKIHSMHADSQRALTNFYSYTIWKTSLCFTDQETREPEGMSVQTGDWRLVIPINVQIRRRFKFSNLQFGKDSYDQDN